MAFNKYGLVVNTKGRNAENRLLNYNTPDDALATVKGSGYFNNAQSTTPLKVGDEILVTATDGIATLSVSALGPTTVLTYTRA